MLNSWCILHHKAERNNGGSRRQDQYLGSLGLGLQFWLIHLARRLIPGQSGPLERATEQCPGSASPEEATRGEWTAGQTSGRTEKPGKCWDKKSNSPGQFMKGVELDQFPKAKSMAKGWISSGCSSLYNIIDMSSSSIWCMFKKCSNR